ncbi:helix-turn-helix domain-containing protein [Salmonella enterica subsp. enterica serovar Rubislaw]|nr:helix-turn-helix domain-containing protein [Salmonella enterica subsp. enterica serovar Rubislaw]
METKNIRRTNLKHLLDVSGLSQAAFAERCGLAASVISQLVNGHRNLGDAISRRIEESLSVKKGWLDVPHGESEDDLDYDDDDRPYLSLDKKRVVELFRKLPESERNNIISQLQIKVDDYDRLFNELIKVRNLPPNKK